MTDLLLYDIDQKIGPDFPLGLLFKMHYVNCKFGQLIVTKIFKITTRCTF